MNKAAAGLLIVGLLQMTGDFLGLPVLRGIGAATCASPAPKVFSAVRGFETYSTRFFIDWKDQEGIDHELELTPELYARVRGPYNRRNVYGAALAYGPVLPAELRAPVMTYALCGEAPLLSELGIDRTHIAGPVRIRYEPLPGTSLGDLPRILEAPCP
jgi:hypothetical protein